MTVINLPIGAAVAAAGITSVRAYGARGDGVTDDTAAITAALATGKDVFVPDGTYIVSNLAIPNEWQQITGQSEQGTVLKAKAGATFVLQISGLRYDAVRTLTIDGNAGASKGLLVAATAGATSQQQYAERVLFQNCSIGLHIANVGLTQADKNTLMHCTWLGNTIGLEIDSVNSQETILINPNFGYTANNQIGVFLNGGGSLGILGGQSQGNGVATGVISIKMTGANLDRVWLKDFVDENIDTSIDGSGGWPALGVELDQVTLQGTTANVKMGVAAGGAGGARLYATLSRFNAGLTSGGGVINSSGADGLNKAVLEDCNVNVTGSVAAPVFTGNIVLQPGEVPRFVGTAGNPGFNGATDFANAGGGYRSLCFYMDRGGVVHVEGQVKTVLGQAADVTIFTLPVGYRPAANSRVNGAGTITSTNAYCRVDVDPAGNVKPEAALAANATCGFSIAYMPGV